MDLYVSDDAVAALEADAARSADPAVLAELAWHLRQRDTARSLALVLGAEALPEARAASLRARLLLTRAECLLLQYRLDEAEAHVARLGAEGLRGEAIVEGDTCLLEAAIANARGAPKEEIERARRAKAAFEAAGDARRVALAIAAELTPTVSADPQRTRAQIERLREASDDRALDAHLAYVAGCVEFTAGNFAPAIELLAPAAEGAARAGAGELGLRSLLTLAAALSNLGDREESAKAGEEALARARALGWPRPTAGALAHLGRLFTFMEQPERAVPVLEEAVAIFSAQPGSRHYAMALFYLADAHLHGGEPQAALDRLVRSEAIARRLAFPPELSANLALAGRALARLGRREEALAKAHEGLELARACGARLWEAEAQRTLAEAFLEHEPREALRHLEGALEASRALGGHHEKSRLLVEIARVHERIGDLAAALAAERAARAEQLAEQHRRAANQVLVSRMRHEMALLAESEAEMRRLATTDVLTGLANRRHFFSLAEAEVARCARGGVPLGLVMGDVDRFKAINDAHGHPAGDAVLAAVARAIGAETRPGDVAGRLGGEEFGLMLPGAAIDQVLAAAERLRARIEALELAWEGRRIPVTISLGCVSTAPHAASPQEAAAAFAVLYREADAALYEAKRGGRNRCVAPGQVAASA